MDIIKKTEKWLISLAIVHLIFLIIAQTLLSFESITPLLNEAIQYEGVGTEDKTKTLKTMEDTPYLWYHQ